MTPQVRRVDCTQDSGQIGVRFTDSRRVRSGFGFNAPDVGLFTAANVGCEAAECEVVEIIQVRPEIVLF